MKSHLVKKIVISNKIYKKQNYLNMYKVLPKVNKIYKKQSYLNMYKVLSIYK
jgi:hypothetical protein